MDNEIIKKILSDYKKEKISLDEAQVQLNTRISQQIGSEVIFDISREDTSGIPEVVLAETKEPELCLKMAEIIVDEKDVLLFTRCTEKHFKAFRNWDKRSKYNLEENKKARTILVFKPDYEFKIDPNEGLVAIVTAGTTDIPVAEEAIITLKAMNIAVETFHDVGIAGLHRIQYPIQKIKELKPKCVLVFAGMEGALPSVIAGLVPIPVIGIPISQGSYGYGSGGKAALMSMLQSCSPGLAVVNIDGGFRAATIAALIVRNIRS